MEEIRIDIPSHVMDRLQQIIERRSSNWLKMVVRAPDDANKMYLEVGKLQAAESILNDIKSNFRPL